ncbi:type IX secretion system membrane protein PorP/SprF [Flavobacterium aquidurense]|uniref:PorP/SprF family type IX secretion system membrane protein n=1 Tax=Flavobacterium aquidurense TaxID=362413 RepID=UPI00285C17DA|nr:type IX secretion system membrane protein PorP/SprF [Flavobacterium aquidurense]MDR7371774.1 type IX secretion system PorP/SprF family membrane protein [Flavobacterium aquidurense]
MKKMNYVLTGMLLFIGSNLFAQQEINFTMYRYHMNMINPAYAAIDDETMAVISYRDQWSGVAEAPKSQAVSFSTPLGRNLGIGVSVVNDKTFIEKQTFLGIDVSYKLQIGAEQNIYFGIKAGGNSFNVNASGLNTYNIQADPALGDISSFTPNVGAGAVLKGNGYFVSFSVPRILSMESAKTDAGYASVITDRPQFYLSGGYDFILNETFVLKPTMLMRYVSKSPVSIDLTTLLQINNIFEIGASYRTDKALAAIADFTINKRLTFGYAYEVSTRPELASARATNEFVLKFTFN